MKAQITSDWTKEEFKAYLLLYAAHADFFRDDAEKETILSMVDAQTYQRILKEIEKDNDYQRIQKIIFNIERFKYSSGKLNQLIKDIQRVFNSNKEKNEMEEAMLLSLKKIFKEIAKHNKR
jgi:hypothetical protein